jgi:hypothetical protein
MAAVVEAQVDILAQVVQVEVPLWAVLVLVVEVAEGALLIQAALVVEVVEV